MELIDFFCAIAHGLLVFLGEKDFMVMSRDRLIAEADKKIKSVISNYIPPK